MKMTDISMEWTDDGARVLATCLVHCPRCGELCEPNVEHRCGDQVKPPRAVKQGSKQKRAAKPK